MTNRVLKTGTLLYQWLATFAPAYRGVLPAGVVPEDLYIRFDGYADYFSEQFVFPVQIYATNTSSYSSVIALADEIGDAVSEGGLLIGNDETRIKIDKGSPFYQDKEDEDENTRAGYINLLVTVY